MAKKFVRGGVSKDTETKSTISFEPTADNPFPIAQLTNVEVVIVEKKEKDSEEVLGHYPNLVFTFKSVDGERTFTHKEMAVTEELVTDTKTYSIEERFEWQNEKVAKIFNAFAGEGAAQNIALGEGAADEYDEHETLSPEDESGILHANYAFMMKVADTFNKYTSQGQGKAKTPVYQNKAGKPIFVWIKLVRNNRDYLQFPLYGNFIMPYVKDKKCLLQLTARERVEPKPKAANAFIPNVPAAPENNGLADDTPPGF
jgi:hypothetical protein